MTKEEFASCALLRLEEEECCCLPEMHALNSDRHSHDLPCKQHRRTTHTESFSASLSAGLAWLLTLPLDRTLLVRLLLLVASVAAHENPVLRAWTSRELLIVVASAVAGPVKLLLQARLTSLPFLPPSRPSSTVVV